MHIPLYGNSKQAGFKSVAVVPWAGQSAPRFKLRVPSRDLNSAFSGPTRPIAMELRTQILHAKRAPPPIRLKLGLCWENREVFGFCFVLLWVRIREAQGRGLEVLVWKSAPGCYSYQEHKGHISPYRTPTKPQGSQKRPELRAVRLIRDRERQRRSRCRCTHPPPLPVLVIPSFRAHAELGHGLSLQERGVTKRRHIKWIVDVDGSSIKWCGCGAAADELEDMNAASEGSGPAALKSLQK